MVLNSSSPSRSQGLKAVKLVLLFVFVNNSAPIQTWASHARTGNPTRTSRRSVQTLRLRGFGPLLYEKQQKQHHNTKKSKKIEEESSKLQCTYEKLNMSDPNMFSYETYDIDPGKAFLFDVPARLLAHVVTFWKIGWSLQCRKLHRSSFQ
uniref:Uncharacterized protein n=1 Tax=Guillardia theta TaxID=55529 RepID=A0A7S4HB36_GUITH|mmetsp:Transcript_1283/g.3946  ORF Transcript_1283/g.3946 Transcript_1283/m.3946 type:complete len:150 (+) Transcript_1283:152-601(+)